MRLNVIITAWDISTDTSTSVHNIGERFSRHFHTQLNTNESLSFHATVNESRKFTVMGQRLNTINYSWSFGCQQWRVSHICEHQSPRGQKPIAILCVKNCCNTNLLYNGHTCKNLRVLVECFGFFCLRYSQF